MALSMNFVAAEFHLLSVTGVALCLGLYLAFTVAYAVYNALHNVFIHPLKHIPGPILARASGYPLAYHMRQGTLAPWLKKQHDKYGEAVRVAPYEVSFISGETAWQDIYGFRIGKNKTAPYLKDKTWFPPTPNRTRSIIVADDADHTRVRRNFSHAFSDKALRDQEPLIQKYVDLLVNRIGEQVLQGKDVDMMRWYNYTTFDIITDLTFGEPLYCLRDSQYHAWVHLTFSVVKNIGRYAAEVRFPLFGYYDKAKSLFKDTTIVKRTRAEFYELARQKVSKRLESKGERFDFFTHITNNQDNAAKALSREELDSNAVVFLVAGSETTATALSGTTFLLLKNPTAYANLVHEIRNTFSSASDITIDAVNKLEYMIACLQEGLRLYPPVPTGFARTVPAPGDTISGHYIPAGTSVYVSQHTMNHSSRNFTEPDAFVPERWLGVDKYKHDKRETMNAFSFGPRNCLGKNLAYAEMRLILAKILFSFDLELVDNETDWMRTQKLFVLWDKTELNIRLKPVQL